MKKKGTFIMPRENPLKNIVRLQKEGKAIGIYSACTANDLVLRACMQRAKETNSILLIEATANQVDQYGGYTGMKPKDFIRFVEKLAAEEGISMNQIILGGDHLGPLTFTKYGEDKAMAEASELIRQFVGILPMALLFARLFGLSMVWYSFPLAEILGTLYFGLMLHHMYKKEFRRMGIAPDEPF